MTLKEEANKFWIKRSNQEMKSESRKDCKVGHT